MKHPRVTRQGDLGPSWAGFLVVCLVFTLLVGLGERFEVSGFFFTHLAVGDAGGHVGILIVLGPVKAVSAVFGLAAIGIENAVAGHGISLVNPGDVLHIACHEAQFAMIRRR